MPEEYTLKRDRGLIDLDFGANNTICVTEKTQNLRTNTPEIVSREFFTSQQVKDQITNLGIEMERSVEPIKQRIADLTELQSDIEKKEAERSELDKTEEVSQ